MRRVHDLHTDAAARYPVSGRGAFGLREFATVVPEAGGLVTPTIREIVTAYYGGPFRVDSLTSWRIEHVAPNPRHEAYSDFWHCDNAPVSLLKLYVNLSHVRADTGAFRLHPIPSTRAIMRAGYWSRWRMTGRARRLADDPARIVIFDGAPGTACFCNTERCLHRAAIPRAGTYRDIVEIKFAAVSRSPHSRHSP